jgi:hypothetical protein
MTWGTPALIGCPPTTIDLMIGFGCVVGGLVLALALMQLARCGHCLSTWRWRL